MTLSCPSLRKRLLEKSKKSIEAHVEEERIRKAAREGLRSDWMVKRKCFRIETGEESDTVEVDLELKSKESSGHSGQLVTVEAL